MFLWKFKKQIPQTLCITNSEIFNSNLWDNQFSWKQTEQFREQKLFQILNPSQEKLKEVRTVLGKAEIITSF